MPKVRVINIYKQTHLPEEGWFQGCFMCSQITAKTYELKPEQRLENTKFMVYICPDCSRLKNNSADLASQFDLHITRYINRNFNQ